MKKFYFTLFIFFIHFHLFSQTPVHLEWVNTYGNDQYIGSSGVINDNQGNVLIIGHYAGTIDFDPGDEEFLLTSPSEDYGALFIQKLSPSGELIWAKSIGSGITSYVNTIRIDNDGNVVVNGGFQGTVDFDPGIDVFEMTSSYYGFDLFILKLNEEGDFIWAKSLEASSNTNYGGMAIDSSNNIIINGVFLDSLDANPNAESFFLTSPNSYAYFIIKLNEDGALSWAKSIGNDDDALNAFMDCDSEGNVLVTGIFYNTLDLDPGTSIYELTSIADNDIFIMKLDSEGDFIWAQQRGSVGLENPCGIDCDENDNVFLSGNFTAPIYFSNGDSIASSYFGYDNFIEKLNSNGEHLWAKSYGSVSTDYVSSLNTDLNGSVYIYGDTPMAIDYDPGPDEFVFGSDYIDNLYILKLDSSGNFVWVTVFDFNYGIPLGSDLISLNDLGQIYLTGIFSQSCDFDPGIETYELSSVGPFYNSFTLKLSQDSCPNLAIQIDSLSFISCNNPGYIAVQGLNGVEPYSYLWNTNPASEENAITIENSGYYSVVLTDFSGCERTATYLINGPSSEDQFDLNANLIAPSFQPGFENILTVDGFNAGCEYVSGEMILVVDTLFNFISSSLEPNQIIGDSLIWSFTDLNFDSEQLLANCIFTTSMLAEIGDTLCFDLLMNPMLGDADTLNNVKHYCFPVINGYDPNDKQVYPQGECQENYVLKEEALTYTIRFQNTGNSEAINIHIEDQISPFLDINSVNILSSSHEMYTELKEDNVLDFIFNEIHLPDSTSDFYGSQGFVIFEVDPIQEVPEGSVVNNTSSIYFDYNYPIITNTVSNTLVEIIPLCAATSIVERQKGENTIIVYPNPSTGIVNIDLGKLKNVSIKVINQSGQSIYQKESINTKLFQFDLEAAAGSYILIITSEGKSEYVKLMKY